ncbi:hypothetical protein OJAV_G00200330 [Oryzias javanicus]|uniref:Uncharacterized protein n=1 Tax=Oryzias javanicus TaxID=123683 RepID=A0A437C9C8_ORYJA|nr:hypothetical protein OJAV_G00200330 [Oryzias javanicus]
MFTSDSSAILTVVEGSFVCYWAVSPGNGCRDYSKEAKLQQSDSPCLGEVFLRFFSSEVAVFSRNHPAGLRGADAAEEVV